MYEIFMGTIIGHQNTVLYTLRRGRHGWTSLWTAQATGLYCV